MPPIPVFKNAPLKAQGVTPQTAEAGDNDGQQQPTPTPTTTTATSTYDASSPPAPQPGARPVAPTAVSAAPTGGPAAPQPGQAPGASPSSVTAVHTTTETHQVTSPPSQLGIPSPSTNQAPTRSTQTNFVPQASPFQQQDSSSLDHPPGYTQNPYAGDASADRRASIDEAEGDEDGVVGSVKGWLGKAGEGLKEMESSAWKWAQGKG